MDMNTKMNEAPLQKAADFNFQKEAGPMAGPSSWTPSDNAMASNQLSKILASDSKLMTQARANAAAASARRGLLNSSIGVEAGESAAIQSALPIAQQDAGTWASSEQFNANAANQFAMEGNRYGREAALTKYQGILAREAQERDQTWRSGESVLDRAQQLTMQDRDFGFRRGESALDRGLQIDMQDRDQSWRTGERVGSQDFQAGQSVLDRQFQSAERQADRTFQRDERVSAQQYQSGENALQRAFQTGERIGNQDFQAAQAVLDRAQQLRIQQLQEQGMDTRQATQIAAQERAQKADQVFTAEQRAADRQFQTGERVSQQDFASAQAALDRQQQLRVQELQERGMDARQATQIAAQERDAAASRAFSAEQAAVDRQFRGDQAGLDRQQQATLQANSQEWQAAQNRLNQQFQMDFEKFRLPMNMMASFSDRMQGYVTQIMADPNLTPEARDQAIKNYYSYSQQTMGWMSTFFGTPMPNMSGGGLVYPGGPGSSPPPANVGVPSPQLPAPDPSYTPPVDSSGPSVGLPAEGGYDSLTNWDYNDMDARNRSNTR